MKPETNKSLQYKFKLGGQEHTVQVLILSIPEDLMFENINMEENREFIFSIHVRAEPELPAESFDKGKNYFVFLRGKDDTVLAYAENGNLVELHENYFSQVLKVKVLEVLIIAGNGQYSN